jgi:hypothetical protein
LVEPTTNNSLIAYAAKAGAAAEDGNADHSPYTTALLTHLFVPGLDIRMALRLVRDDVVRATGNRQEPFQAGSLGGANIALVPTLPQPTVSASDVQAEYTLIERFASDPRTAIGPAKRAWEAFVKRHPTGLHADLARQRIEKLKEQERLRGAREDGMTLASRDPIVVPAPPAASSEEQKVWNGIKDSSDPARFRDFIRRFPTSVLAKVAEKHLEALAQKEREEKARAEREEKARIAREAQAEREKAAEEARLRAEREAAARRAEEDRLAKLSEAERVRAEREKRLEQERQAKLAEEARLRQEVAAQAARRKAEQAAAQAAQANLDAACKREESRLGSLQAAGWRGRDDLKRLEQELSCERLRSARRQHYRHKHDFAGTRRQAVGYFD